MMKTTFSFCDNLVFEPKIEARENRKWAREKKYDMGNQFEVMT